MSVARPLLKVLFVDDDPLVLQGLQRMLRPMRNEWSMSFVESGAKALEAMAQSPFQVVVSDMRMPSMNGVQLLTEIKSRYPNTVRLVLSGHADNDLILGCVGTAHQFLAKPCETEAIRGAISRASAFEASSKSEQIKRMIVQMDKIPTVPSVYSEIVEKLRDEASSIDDVGALVTKDPAITAKLLKLVNSAFFGLCREISNPTDAVAYLGIDTIKALVLSVNAFGSFESSKVPSFALEKVWAHSLEVAGLARKIMQEGDVPRVYADESFVAGMLHDLGKVILAFNFPEEYERALALHASEKIPMHAAEDKIFGANHADVAGYILSLWGLPARVVEAITYHHDPQGSSSEGLTPLVAVHVANCASNQRKSPPNDSSTSALQHEFLGALGLSEQVPQWMNLDLCQQTESFS